MKRILYICSETSFGMLPFAISIIRAASKAENLDVYAITVDRDRPLCKTYLKDLPEDKIFCLQRPESKFKRNIHKLFEMEILRKVKKISSGHKIDAIHLLTNDFSCATILPQLKKIAHVYFTVHDLVFHEEVYSGIRDHFISKYARWGNNRIMRKAYGLVTNSQHQYISIKNMYPQKRAYFQLFPSLITSSILNGEKMCPEITSLNKYILFFGVIGKYKGIEYLYEAFKNNKNLQEYSLVIAGKGTIYFPHTADQRTVFINRYIEDEEVKTLFNKASCVVYPYISATQSGVLSLAYKFQTPALVSDIPYFREVSNKKTCLFFNRADAEDLSEKLEQLLFNTNLNEMKTAQNDFYENNYSENALISSTEQLYSEI